MATIFTIHEGDVFKASSMLELCHVLTNHDLNRDGLRFEVYNFTSGKFHGYIEYCAENDDWTSITKYTVCHTQGIEKQGPPMIQCKTCTYSSKTDKATVYMCKELDRPVTPWDPPNDCPFKKVKE